MISKIAICMSIYNGAKYLRQQIDSIISQTYDEWVLFVRDDGSTDESLSIIDGYARKYEKKIVVLENSYGNTGNIPLNFSIILDEATRYGDFSYFMFCDQDDIWLDDKIRLSVEFIKTKEYENPTGTPILIHTDLIVTDENLKVMGKSFFSYRALNSEVCDISHLLVQNNVTGSTMMWNKSLNDLIKMDIDGVIMHDWWIALVTSSMGKIYCLNTPTVLYRQHSDNAIGAVKVNSLSFIIHRLLRCNYVKNTLESSFIQAKAFYDIYEDILSEDKRNVILNFVELKRCNKLRRMVGITKGHYVKQGFVQVIGEYMYI